MSYDVKHVKVKAIRDWVLVTDMNFDETVLASGLVLRSDNGKSHGIHPRWGKVYCIGPQQLDVNVGQWILIEHGRWTRKMRINDGDGDKDIWRVDTNGIMAVSDSAPDPADILISDSV
jgi:hypothetical protein